MKKIGMKELGIYGIGLYVALYAVILWFTFYDHRASDGPLSFGFPFPLYFGGGFCGQPCGPDFLLGNALLDLLIFLVPIILGIFFLRKYRNHP